MGWAQGYQQLSVRIFNPSFARQLFAVESLDPTPIFEHNVTNN